MKHKKPHALLLQAADYHDDVALAAARQLAGQSGPCKNTLRWKKRMMRHKRWAAAIRAATLACGLLTVGCIPLPKPIVRASGGDGWSGWRLGLYWGAGPSALEIPEESTAGGSASCGAGSCNESN